MVKHPVNPVKNKKRVRKGVALFTPDKTHKLQKRLARLLKKPMTEVHYEALKSYAESHTA